MAAGQCGRSHVGLVPQQHGRLWLEFLPAYAPELNCGCTGSSTNCPTSIPFRAVEPSGAPGTPPYAAPDHSVIASWQQADLFLL